MSERPYWSETHTLYMVAFILFMFNVAILTIICLLSLMFSNPTTGVSALCAINTFICKFLISFNKRYYESTVIISTIIAAMLLFVNNYGVQFISERSVPTVKQVMSAYPICALIECLSKLTIIGQRCRNMCDEICDREQLCVESPECCREWLWVNREGNQFQKFYFHENKSMKFQKVLPTISKWFPPQRVNEQRLTDLTFFFISFRNSTIFLFMG